MKIFDIAKRVGKSIVLIIVILLLLGGGVVAGFWLASPIAGITTSGCFLQGYETVYCQRVETEKHYIYNVIGVRTLTGEIIKVEHAVPKLKFGTFFL